MYLPNSSALSGTGGVSTVDRNPHYVVLSLIRPITPKKNAYGRILPDDKQVTQLGLLNLQSKNPMYPVSRKLYRLAVKSLNELIFMENNIL